MSGDFSPLGLDLFGEPINGKKGSPLARRFIQPPFTILNAREGEWQERKRAWIGMGIKSELGRAENMLGYSKAANSGGDFYRRKAEAEAAGQEFDPHSIEPSLSGTSIFDPVLCELLYRWFVPPGGSILDPFAGGSVRGIVAGSLGFQYVGVDLRADQVAANCEQRDSMDLQVGPIWMAGDSRELLSSSLPPMDFVLSCPPYGDLEKYSDDPRDLSCMSWSGFLVAYREIIALAVAALRPDRFAAFCVADFRDEAGLYRDFVSKTIDAFEHAGARLYNEAILVTAVGSAAMRADKQFSASRKLVKTHQNVLVFVKGDPRRAADACKAQIGLLDGTENNA